MNERSEPVVVKSMPAQRGVALVVALIFLVVITIVGVASMQSTNTEYRMSTGFTLLDRAFQSAESVRSAIGQVLDAHVYERGWPNHVLPSSSELDINDNNGDGTRDNLYVSNGASEDLMDNSTLTTDATYRVDANNDGDYIDAGDIGGSLAVYKTEVVPAPGSGLAMVAGYEGLGKSAASGGAHIHFELRGTGTAAGGARARVDTDFRVVVRN